MHQPNNKRCFSNSFLTKNTYFYLLKLTHWKEPRDREGKKQEEPKRNAGKFIVFPLAPDPPLFSCFFLLKLTHWKEREKKRKKEEKNREIGRGRSKKNPKEMLANLSYSRLHLIHHFFRVFFMFYLECILGLSRKLNQVLEAIS